MPDLRRLIELRLNSDVIFDPPLRLYVVPLVEGPLTISVTVRLTPHARKRGRKGLETSCAAGARAILVRVCAAGVVARTVCQHKRTGHPRTSEA